MMNSTAVTITKSTILFALLVLALSVNYIYAQWSGAPANPPQNNVATPINEGATDQTKQGALDVLGGVSAGSLLVTNNSAFIGNVGIGTTTPGVPLDVNGIIRTQSQVHANEYCDENGANCFSATSISTSTAGWDYIGKQDHPGNGNMLTFDTGLSGRPANVQVDLVAKDSECGYSPGDVVYDLGSSGTVVADRFHDWGIVTASDGGGLVRVKISARGLAIVRVDSGGIQTCAITQSKWSVVVKASEGDIH